MLQGREHEIRAVEELLSEAVIGAGGVLVVRGEPGMGKSALLDHAERIADGATVLRGAGVETEVELPFAALHLLLHSALDGLDALPEPQAAALRGAFGLAPMGRIDRFLVGLATLSLLSELAEKNPLLVIIDDAQWLDEASAATVLFAARRLRSEGVAVLIAARDEPDAFPTSGLPELRLEGLAPDESARLLGDGLPAHLREQVLKEAEGNPLALIELAKAAAAGRLEESGSLPLTRRLLDAFASQINRLEEPTRRMLAVAAAEDTGTLGVVLAASGALGVHPDALEPAELAGLVTVTGGEVRFRHPLLRSAAYQAVPSSQLRAIHKALAGTVSGDRRAWHLALAATGPDAEIAGALEESAERAGARLGFASMAAAYERSAQLSTDQGDVARRLAAGAMAAKEAGQSRRAAELSERASKLASDPATLARLDEFRAAVAFEEGAPRRAARLLVDGATGIAEADPRSAARMLMAAAHSIWTSGDPGLASEASKLLNGLDLPEDDGMVRLTRGLGMVYRGELETGYPLVSDFLKEMSPADAPGEQMAVHLAFVTGRIGRAVDLAGSLAARCRAEGRIRQLPFALNVLAYTQAVTGRHRDARDNATEGLQIALDTGQHHPATALRSQLAWLAAVAGDEETARPMAEEVIEFSARHNVPALAVLGSWGLAQLDLTHGRDQAALDRLQARPDGSSHFRTRIVADEVEAAVRLGAPELVADSLALAERWSALSGEPWAAAIVARCRGLVDDVEEPFLTAMEMHRLAPQPYERARTQLSYGEWLRRRRRKADARPHLRSAHEAFEDLGARAWAERASAELRASGEATVASRRGAAPGLALTAQELQVVRLAATGATNRDIAAHLLLSPRTIGQHLYKAFPKLGISSRTELARLDLDSL